jgi:hypothetical protein
VAINTLLQKGMVNFKDTKQSFQILFVFPFPFLDENNLVASVWKQRLKGVKVNFSILNCSYIFAFKGILLILPLFWVHCDYFEYKNFSG